jgi:outer membrane protein OmpA-like peptidoglycan-associated protein
MRARHRLRLLSTLGALSFAALTPTVALAQQEGEFSAQRFEPAPGSKNYFSVEGARTDGYWGFTAGLSFNYSRDPFLVVSCKSQTDCDDKNATLKEDTPVISDMFTWDLLASVTPTPRLQVGLRAPFSYVNGAGVDTSSGGPVSGGAKAFGVGDPTLEGKLRFFGGAKDPFVLGAALDISGPVGHATASGNYIGNQSPVTVGLRGIFDGEAGPLSFGLNLKGIYRDDATIGSTTVGPEFRYGAGAGYRLSPVFRVIAEGFGGTRFSSKNGTNSLEVDGGFEIEPLGSMLVVKLGGGTGVIAGAGVPKARGIAMVMFVNEVGDEDADGVDDKSDQCPTIPEDRDEFEDDDGCPEDDNDHDKILDVNDKCPNVPETINGFQDEDGCPDEVSDRDKDGIADDIDKCPDQPGRVRQKEYYGCPDKDGDGVADPADKCPDQPEDTDGFEDTDGCPDPDNDGDGIPDEGDECIDQPEIKNGYKDEDGCPDEAPDRDKDGIPDAIDKCPNEPETFNGVFDEDGCPEKGPQLVQLSETGIKILERVEFATGSDKIQGGKSFQVLDAVGSVLKMHPEIALVEVAGHTDNAGVAAQNTALSQKRAEAVARYLKTKGIDEKRLQPKGYGPDKPIADNATPTGRQKNRRVEFTILKSTKVEPAKP